MVMGMRVYIDLIYVVNVILGIACLLTLSILIGSVFSLKKMMLLGLLWGGHVITLYTHEGWYYLWVVLICLLLESKHRIRNCLLFLFIHETYLNSLSGIYRIGHVLVLGEQFDWVLPILMGSFIICIYMFLWFQMRKDILGDALIETIEIYVDDINYNYLGFMDTGNQMLYEGLPVIFFRIDTTPFTKHQKARIYYKEKLQDCCIEFLETLDVDADCLLNYYLL